MDVGKLLENFLKDQGRIDQMLRILPKEPADAFVLICLLVEEYAEDLNADPLTMWQIMHNTAIEVHELQRRFHDD